MHPLPVEAMDPGPSVVGRYAIYDRIAAGGMATVHLGRQLGGAGFARTVAIKRLHAQFALDPDFVDMFVDEGRLASRIRHANVVSTLDVVHEGNELFIVMEFVEGEALSPLVRASKKAERASAAIAVAIVIDALQGLHAAHTATNEHGEALNIVHRDVSPQNLLVGTDGITRVLDFGVAKAMGRIQTTREGHVKGKLQYMAPEHLSGAPVSPRSDIFAASIVLWELLTSRNLFTGEGEGRIVNAVLTQEIKKPSELGFVVPPALEEVLMRGLERDPQLRFATAAEMVDALERAVTPAHRRDVGDWVKKLAPETLEQRRKLVADIEASAPSAHSRIQARQGSSPEHTTPEQTAPDFVLPVASSRAPAPTTTGEATTLVRPRVPLVPREVRIAAGIGGAIFVVFTIGVAIFAGSTSKAPVIAPATAESALAEPEPPATAAALPLTTAAATAASTATPTGVTDPADTVIDLGESVPHVSRRERRSERDKSSTSGAASSGSRTKIAPRPQGRDGIYSRE